MRTDYLAACLHKKTTKTLTLGHTGALGGEGNGTPLQYSCLEDTMDGESLVGCSPWGHTESDTTEATWQQQQQLLV